MPEEAGQITSVIEGKGRSVIPVFSPALPVVPSLRVVAGGELINGVDPITWLTDRPTDRARLNGGRQNGHQPQ